jgi:hypothetical protein
LAGGRRDQGCDPHLRQERKRHAYVPDAAANSALQETEFNPGGDACGDGKTGDAPARVDAGKARNGVGAQIAEDGGEQDTRDGKSQRGARVAQSVETRGVQAGER